MESIAPDKKGMTIGNGFIDDKQNFTHNKALGYAGKVRVQADTNAYYLDGGVRLLHNCLPPLPSTIGNNTATISSSATKKETNYPKLG